MSSAMSVRQVVPVSPRPDSAATPTRNCVYPSKPIARQNLVTVAAEVPAWSASSVMVSSTGAVGWVEITSAILAMALGIAGRRSEMRCVIDNSLPTSCMSGTIASGENESWIDMDRVKNILIRSRSKNQVGQITNWGATCS